MDKTARNLIIGLTGAVVVLLGVLCGGMYRLLEGQPRRLVVQHAVGPMPMWTSDQGAAPDSMEGKLRREGKWWIRTQGEIRVGAYVQDILEGRLNQPDGRGAIGKVLAVSPPDAQPRAATIDFGRGYVTGINFSELTVVLVVPKNQ